MVALPLAYLVQPLAHLALPLAHLAQHVDGVFLLLPDVTWPAGVRLLNPSVAGTKQETGYTPHLLF